MCLQWGWMGGQHIVILLVRCFSLFLQSATRQFGKRHFAGGPIDSVEACLPHSLTISISTSHSHSLSLYISLSLPLSLSLLLSLSPSLSFLLTISRSPSPLSLHIYVYSEGGLRVASPQGWHKRTGKQGTWPLC